MTLPDSLEVFDCLLFDGNRGKISLAEERIDNDGDEQIKEHLRHNNLEEQMEANSPIRAAAFRTIWVVRISAIGYNAFIGLVFFALVQDGVRLGGVEHNGVPSLAS